MINTASLAFMRTELDNIPAQATHVMVEKTIIRGIIAELETLKNGLGRTEQERIHLIQRMTMDFILISIVDTLKQMSLQEYPNMTANEVLLMAADRLKNSHSEVEQKMGGVS